VQDSLSLLLQTSGRFCVVVSALVSISEVTPGPVSTGMGDRVRGSTPVAGKSISVYNQSPRSTQPGYPSGDTLRLGSKDRYGSWMGGRQVTTVIPLLSRAKSLSVSSNGFISQ